MVRSSWSEANHSITAFAPGIVIARGSESFLYSFRSRYRHCERERSNPVKQFTLFAPGKTASSRRVPTLLLRAFRSHIPRLFEMSDVRAQEASMPLVHLLGVLPHTVAISSESSVTSGGAFQPETAFLKPVALGAFTPFKLFLKC